VYILVRQEVPGVICELQKTMATCIVRRGHEFRDLSVFGSRGVHMARNESVERRQSWTISLELQRLGGDGIDDLRCTPVCQDWQFDCGKVQRLKPDFFPKKRRSRRSTLTHC
jgi:hypothetical protein